HKGGIAPYSQRKKLANIPMPLKRYLRESAVVLGRMANQRVGRHGVDDADASTPFGVSVTFPNRGTEGTTVRADAGSKTGRCSPFFRSGVSVGADDRRPQASSGMVAQGGGCSRR